MAIQVHWYKQRHDVIHFTFDGQWQMSELLEAFKQAYNLAETVPHTVHIYHEFVQESYVPSDALKHARAAIRALHPRYGKFFVLHGSSLAKNILEVIKAIYRDERVKNHIFIKSEAELEAYLDNLDKLKVEEGH